MVQPLASKGLEFGPCPLCASEKRVSPAYRFSPFGVVRCQDCGLWYLYPRTCEEEMLSLYLSGGYYEGRDDRGYSDYGVQTEALRRTFRRFLRSLARRGMTGGALLEVGCAYGYLLEEAKGFFRQRVGLDFAVDAVNRAREVADRVYLGGIEELEQAEGAMTYEAIVAIQVIEHVYDPVSFVERLVQRLTVGGVLVLATPDIGSAWRWVMQRHWPSFRIPEHVAFYDAQSLKRLLCRVGLGEIRRLPYPHAFPLSLVAAKLGLRIPGWLGRRSVWIPATTIALVGRKL